MRTIPLRRALLQSSSCFVSVIRSRIEDGHYPNPDTQLVDAGEPPIAMVTWRDDMFAPLFIKIDRPAAEVHQ